MSTVNYAAPSLDVTSNPNYHPIAEETLVMNFGDLSQLGIARNKLRPELCIPLVHDVRCIVPKSAGHGLWKNMFKIINPDNDDLADLREFDVIMDINTMPLRDLDLQTGEITEDQIIVALQASLDPKQNVDHIAIIESEKIQNALTAIGNRARLSSARIAGAMTNAASMNERLSRWIMDNLMTAEETRTVVGSPEMSANVIYGLDYATFTQLGALAPEVVSEYRSDWDVIDFEKLRSATHNDVSTFQHDMIKDVYNMVRADMMTQSFKCPAPLANMFERAAGGRFVDLTIRVAKEGKSYGTELKDASKSLLGELAIYMLSFHQLSGVSAERAREYAFTRTLVVRHELFLDNDEISPMAIDGNLETSMTEVVEWARMVRQPEKFYTCMYAACASFIRSGHHATAANLDNHLCKMLAAINVQVNKEHARQLLNTSVYNGTHPASMRLMLAYCMWRGRKQKISAAISYRLHSAPPFAMAYTNLEIFMDALHAADFFFVLNRESEYRSFKEHLRTIKESMYYVAPYADYLYGKTAAEPSYERSEAAKSAAYAAALNSALPSTTLVFSPALKKLSEQASVNSIGAQLMVEGYAEAFRRYFKTTISKTLTDRKKITFGQAALPPV